MVNKPATTTAGESTGAVRAGKRRIGSPRCRRHRKGSRDDHPIPGSLLISWHQLLLRQPEEGSQVTSVRPTAGPVGAILRKTFAILRRVAGVQMHRDELGVENSMATRRLACARKSEQFLSPFGSLFGAGRVIAQLDQARND